VLEGSARGTFPLAPFFKHLDGEPKGRFHWHLLHVWYRRSRGEEGRRRVFKHWENRGWGGHWRVNVIGGGRYLSRAGVNCEGKFI